MASTSSVATTSTTTSVAPAVVSARYIGTLTLPPPALPLPLDLSLFFNLPAGALDADDRRVRPRAIYNVTGGYNTGSGGFTGSITGTLDGSPESGVFSGVMTANLANGCVARRNYSGPLTREALNWTPGTQLETCGGQSPLTAPVTPPAAPQGQVATTSVPVTTTSVPVLTTTTTSTPTTTSVPVTTTVTTTVQATTTVPGVTTTSSTSSSTTSSSSSSTTSSSSSTTSSSSSSTISTTSTTSVLPPQSKLGFTFIPNPIPPTGVVTGCNGTQIAYKTWHYTLEIVNASTVPFTVTAFTFETNEFTSKLDGAQFGAIFGTSTIGANATVQGRLCVFFQKASSGSVKHTLTGANGNGPFTSPTAALLID